MSTIRDQKDKRTVLNRRSLLTRGPLARALCLLFIAALLAVALRTAPTPAQSVQAIQGGTASRPASPSATLSDAGWHALPNHGLDLRVRALAVSGSNLYVGGGFTQTVDGSVTNLNYIARYDTAGSTWHALSNQGLSNEVTALAVVGSDLYAGGWFTQSVDGSAINLNHIARYDTTGGTWHALSNQGLNDSIFALAVVGSDLYVGGTFTQSGDGSVTDLNYIARYDTAAGTWHALSNNGLNGTVYALAVSGSDLYAGGTFNQSSDGSVTDLNHVAHYDTTSGTWYALPKQGLNDFVTALAASGSDLYAGGYFTQSGDGTLSLGRIARYDTTGSAWHALPNQGLSNQVMMLAAVGSDLYAGGSFTQSGDGTVTDLNYIARYDTTASTWNALPNQGLNGWVYTLAVVGNGLYVGGEFSQTGDGSPLGHIARYTVGTVYLPLVLRQYQ
jgi:N-acetylneuraminic acid mutarotase